MCLLCAVANFYQLEIKSLNVRYMERYGCVACKGLFNTTERSAAIWKRFFVNSTRRKHRETVFFSEAKLSKQVVRLLESAMSSGPRDVPEEDCRPGTQLCSLGQVARPAAE